MSRPKKIYIFGPSGSGTTTLAKSLSEGLSIFHLDTDDHYWQVTDPPYKEVFSIEERLESINGVLGHHDNWIISGCMCSWGESVLSDITHVIYLWIPWNLRRQRLRSREINRYGQGCLDPGGDRREHYAEFEKWARNYDSADGSMRSRVRHDSWIDEACSNLPLLKMEVDEPVEDRTRKAIEWLCRDSGPINVAE